MKKLIDYIEKGIFINFSVMFILIPYSRSVPKICFCVAMTLWVALNGIRYKKKFYQGLIPHTFLNLPIFLFLGAGLCSVFLSRDPYHSQSIFFERYVPFVFFFLIMSGVLKQTARKAEIQARRFSFKNVFFLVGSLLLSAFILGIGGVYDCLAFHPARLFTVFGREIPFLMFPLYLIYFIPLSYALLMFSKKRWLKISSGIVLFLSIFCWVWQGSRMSWIAIPLTLLIITFIKNRKMAFILTLVFLIIFSLFPQSKVERAKKLFVIEEWTVPFEVWGVALSIFKDYPVFGAGIGMYEEFILPYGERLGYPRIRTKYLHAHNVYLEIAAELGGVGLITFLYIFVVFFSKTIKKLKMLSREQSSVLLGLMGTVSATLLLGFWCSIIITGLQGPSMFWSLLGMAVFIVEQPMLQKNEKIG